MALDCAIREMCFGATRPSSAVLVLLLPISILCLLSGSLRTVPQKLVIFLLDRRWVRILVLG